jgi:CubicO group peptidase (beta-lactamase class C family)
MKIEPGGFGMMFERIKRHGAVAVFGTLIVAAPALAAIASPPTDAERFERLAERIEAARVEQHIPGVALAVVRDDKVIFAKGFGLANVEEQTPVTPETLFAIGSTTKAFTSAVIGMLVDEGKMTWDDPVTKWLPELNLHIDAADGEQVLIRDMLSHQTGFTRMSMLWVSGKAPRAEILRTASKAEPFAPFREQFLYNNIMFMAAGEAAGQAAGSSWESLIENRIFEPLGMDDSVLTIAKAQADPRLALGYSWKNDAWKHDPMRNIDTVGPAGSIDSNVLDMAEWIRFQLGHGTYEGKELLSEQTHAEMWKPQMKMGGDVNYGFGWMLREWDGKRLVEHGGNIDGFAAEVALLPDANIGFVLLTNTGYAPLQSGSINIVFDSMLGDRGDDDHPVAAQTGLEEFTGVYIANYGQFEDERFTVSIKDDGRLSIDIPSQREFVLDAPGDDGRREFADVPGIAATFERDDQGKVVVLHLYQGGLKFDVPREGYTYPIEVPLDELDKYTGKYFFTPMNANMEVLVRNNHLAVDVPNQMVFEIFPPDENGKWQFRTNDKMKIAVSFQKAEYGAIESMTMYQSGQEFVLPRQTDEAAKDLPTLEEIFALAKLDERQKSLEISTFIQLVGRVTFAQSGLEGDALLTFDGGTRYRNDIDTGDFGRLHTMFNGEQAWQDFSFNPLEELTGRKFEEARREHPAAFLGDWRSFYDEVRVDGRDEVDGTPVLVIKAKRTDYPMTTLYLDAETGDPLQIDSATELAEFGNIRIPVTTYLRDWRDVDGLRIAHEITAETQQNGRIVIKVDEVQKGFQIDAKFFLPDSTDD